LTHVSQTEPLSAAGSQGSEHPIGRARSLLELTGWLLIVGASAVQAGFALTAGEDESLESAGDFFGSVGVVQLFVVPLIVLGVLVAVAPRLFFRWPVALSSVGLGLLNGFAIILAASSVVFAAGATITSLARASDDEFDVGAGDWVLAAGITIAAAASFVLAIAGALAARAPEPRQRSQPIL
jgi:hypothetical protein